MSTPRLALVSPPGGSLFLEELLASVAEAVGHAGGTAVRHRGWIDEVIDETTVAVVIPHEYARLHPDPEPRLLRRTLGFGVERPGTAAFEVAARFAPHLGGWVEIAPDAVTEMRRRGVRCRRFVLGHLPSWDERRWARTRDVDVTYLGTADEVRMRQLARIGVDLEGYRTELLLPPEEPMTRPRPDFVIGEAKRKLLARSRLLLNLHREGATAFEWVRALDAISNGCVVLTTPSSGAEPLVAGEHLLVAEPARIGRVAAAALCDPETLQGLADAAFAHCREHLDMVDSAWGLLDVAVDVAARARYRPRRRWTRRPGAPPDAGDGDAALAAWVPRVDPVPVVTAGDVRPAPSEPGPPAVVRQPVAPADVDVVCVRRRGDGPLSLTLDSLGRQQALGARVALHLASDGAGALRVAGPGFATRATFAEPAGRGVARNHLLSRGSAPYVLVIDAGDEVLGATLVDLVERLRQRVELCVAYPMAVLGSALVVNALVPEKRRLERFAYLDRGFLVRRSFLDSIGGFVEGPGTEGSVDHEFWRRTAARGPGVELVRQVGIRLWDRRPATARVI